MLRDLFCKLKEAVTSNKPAEEPCEFQPEKEGTSTFGRAFDDTKTYRKTNTGELSQSALASRSSAKNYRSAVGSYLQANAAKADNFDLFNIMLNPAQGVFLSGPERKSPRPSETTAKVQVPVLEISAEEVMHEILDKMQESAVERNMSDEAHLSSEKADVYRRNWVLRTAADEKTPDIILRRLADEGDSAVRALVAENPSTPIDAMWKLARDSDADIRYAVAENHYMAIEVLNQLTADENPYVCQRAQKTLLRIRGGVVFDGMSFNANKNKKAQSAL